jgi:hypothetical protein
MTRHLRNAAMTEKQVYTSKMLSDKSKQLDRIKTRCLAIKYNHLPPRLINALLISAIIPGVGLSGLHWFGLKQFMLVSYYLALLAFVFLFLFFYFVKPIGLSYYAELDLILSEYDPINLDAFLKLQTKLKSTGFITVDDVYEWLTIESEVVDKKQKILRVTEKFISRKLK